MESVCLRNSNLFAIQWKLGHIISWDGSFNINHIYTGTQSGWGGGGISTLLFYSQTKYQISLKAPNKCSYGLHPIATLGFIDILQKKLPTRIFILVRKPPGEG